jgi:hypothetical protein|tara:strand:- start:482 stop:706 length:225 start_codon:yes stop_codon:yes gene_type:complete
MNKVIDMEQLFKTMIMTTLCAYSGSSLFIIARDIINYSIYKKHYYYIYGIKLQEYNNIGLYLGFFIGINKYITI